MRHIDVSWPRAVRLTLLALLSCMGTAAHAQAKATPLPIERFFENPEFTAAVLSPNAKALAVRFGGAGVRERLAVVDLQSNTIKVVAQFSAMDMGYFEWVNDERLVFDLRDKRIGQADVRYGPGLYAVNRDGSDFRQLATTTGNVVREHGAPIMLPWNTFLVRQKGRQDSEFVYVTSPKYDETGEIQHVGLMRLNTLTGRAQAVQRPGATRTWLLDHTGQPRLATVLERNIQTIFYRDPDDKWRKLVAFNGYTGGRGAFAPLAFGPDGTLYVSSNENKDKSALHTFDFAANRVRSEPLIELDDYDFSGALLTDNNKLLGVRYLSDAEATVWFDPNLKAVQATLDALLPSTNNLISVAARPETPWVLVKSYSDRQAPVYALFNTETKAFNKVGETYPNIVPSQMATQEIVRYKARDGLEIPAWLTLPNGSERKNLPLVVLVHGGPYVRGGQWGWDPEAQFLASRGYAVLEPEFRGSTGFGQKHYRAGWKQWGLAMQDDIADGAKWAIAQGIVDPKRICIAGASYGGYATLMGLVNDPDLYKCGIDWVGVTDIKLMYTGHWSFTSDLSESYKQYGMPDLVGDLVKDAAQLEATSPLVQAARITQPLLLAYGGADERVPLYHGKKFYEAVKRTNPSVEWVVYQDEGHGWAVPKNRVDFWSRVEKFLDKHIGKP